MVVRREAEGVSGEAHAGEGHALDVALRLVARGLLQLQLQGVLQLQHEEALPQLDAALRAPEQQMEARMRRLEESMAAVERMLPAAGRPAAWGEAAATAAAAPNMEELEGRMRRLEASVGEALHAPEQPSPPPEAPSAPAAASAVGEEEREKRRVEEMVVAARARRAKARADPFALGDTLCRAILNRRSAEIRALVEQGADVNYVDPKGDTPLINAVGAPDPDEALVALLLQKGADANGVDTNGKTALHRCVVGPRTCWALRPLVRAGARVDARDLNGETPLHWAALQENEAAARALLDAGAARDLRYWAGFWAGQTPHDVARPGPLRQLLRPAQAAAQPNGKY